MPSGSDPRGERAGRDRESEKEGKKERERERERCSDTSERIESALLLPSGRRSLTVRSPIRAAGVDKRVGARRSSLITESRFRRPRIVKSMRALSLTFFKGRIEDAINNCPSLIALVPIPPINLRMSCGNLQ